MNGFVGSGAIEGRDPERSSHVRARLTDVLDRTTRAAEVLIAPNGWRALVGRPPRSVASFRLVRGLHDRGVRPATIIDVGANRGQFSNAALHRWPEARIIAFEPVEEAADELEAIRAYGAFEAHRVVLGPSDETVDFHVHPYTLSSSVLPALDPIGEDDPPVRPLRQRRLDSVLGVEQLARPVLMKLDVQGYELEVLKGSAQVLAAVDFIVLELSIVAAYRHQPRFAALNRHLEELGFELDRFLDVRREHGAIVETDGLYRATESR